MLLCNWGNDQAYSYDTSIQAVAFIEPTSAAFTERSRQDYNNFRSLCDIPATWSHDRKNVLVRPTSVHVELASVAEMLPLYIITEELRSQVESRPGQRPPTSFSPARPP